MEERSLTSMVIICNLGYFDVTLMTLGVDRSLTVPAHSSAFHTFHSRTLHPHRQRPARTSTLHEVFSELYYSESTKARDLEQVVRKLRPHKGDAMICVSQVWAIVLGSGKPSTLLEIFASANFVDRYIDNILCHPTSNDAWRQDSDHEPSLNNTYCTIVSPCHRSVSSDCFSSLWTNAKPGL